MRKFEILVKPDGSTTVETHGFNGNQCLIASRFLERALGTVQGERRTTEAFAVSVHHEQHQQTDAISR